MCKIIPLQGTACESKAKINKKKEIEIYSKHFNTNLTEKRNLIKNTTHCTNRAESTVSIGVLRCAVLSRHCTGIVFKAKHYNKSMPILKRHLLQERSAPPLQNPYR